MTPAVIRFGLFLLRRLSKRLSPPYPFIWQYRGTYYYFDPYQQMWEVRPTWDPDMPLTITKVRQ